MRIYKYDVGKPCPECPEGRKIDIVDHETGLCRWHWAAMKNMDKCDACQGAGSYCTLDGGEHVTLEEAIRHHNTTGEVYVSHNCERCVGFGFIVPPTDAPSRGQAALF